MLADIVWRMTQGLDDEAFIAGPQGHLDRASKRRAHDHGSPHIPASAVGPLFEDTFRLVTARDVPATLFFLPFPMPPASELMEVFSFFQAEPPVAIGLLAVAHRRLLILCHATSNSPLPARIHTRSMTPTTKAG